MRYWDLTFKENCPDTRNTKVIDIYNELREYGISASVVDPEADSDEAKRLYGIDFKSEKELCGLDAVITAVAHTAFKAYDVRKYDGFYNGSNKQKILFDIKGIYDRKQFENKGYSYWRL